MEGNRRNCGKLTDTVRYEHQLPQKVNMEVVGRDLK